MTKHPKKLLRVLEAMEALRELDENRLREGQLRKREAEQDLTEIIAAAARETESAAAFPELYARHAQRLSDEIRGLEERAKIDAQTAAKSGLQRDRVAERYNEARDVELTRTEDEIRAEFMLSSSRRITASPPQALRRRVKPDQ